MAFQMTFDKGSNVIYLLRSCFAHILVHTCMATFVHGFMVLFVFMDSKEDIGMETVFVKRK